MGLNIGIRVKRQFEGYMSHGRNPHGTREEIETELDAKLEQKFPDGDFTLSVYCGKKDYDFDIRFGYYARQFSAKGYQFSDMYLVLAEYIFDNFSTVEGIDMHVYFTP